VLRHQHTAGRKQSWETADTDIREFVERLVGDVSELLEPSGFVGAYLHGSLAAGSFYRPKSDLDILFVVHGSMSVEQRRKAAHALCNLSDARPIIGEIETSIVLLSNTLNFQHPLPFEFHYSETHKEAFRNDTADFAENSKDFDMAVYCSVIQKLGICLNGAPIDTTFGDVPVEYYRAAIVDDLDWILENENILESPFYGVLNCCRVLEQHQNGWQNFFTKDEGGEWAIKNLPADYHAIISQALACYRSSENVSADERRTDGHDWDRAALLSLRDYVRQQNIGS